MEHFRKHATRSTDHPVRGENRSAHPVDLMCSHLVSPLLTAVYNVVLQQRCIVRNLDTGRKTHDPVPNLPKLSFRSHGPRKQKQNGGPEVLAFQIEVVP